MILEVRKMSTLSANIKKKMEENKLSAHALEKQAGLKPSAVHNVLSGRSKNPSVSLIQTIAQELNCTVSDLLGESPSVSLLKEEWGRSPRISNTEEKIPWKSELYIKSLETVSKILKSQNLHIPKGQILDYVDEVYLYSLNSKKNNVDKHFVEWVIKRGLK